MWYPVWAQELDGWDSPDVTEAYQGYIENTETGKTRNVETIQDAEALCTALNEREQTP